MGKIYNRFQTKTAQKPYMLFIKEYPPPPLPGVIHLPPRPQSVMGKKVPIWLLHRRRWAQQQAMYPKKYLHGHAAIICDMWKKKFLFLKLWEKERKPNVMILLKVNNIDITTVSIRDKSFENCTWREHFLNLLKLLAGLGFLLFFYFTICSKLMVFYFRDGGPEKFSQRHRNGESGGCIVRPCREGVLCRPSEF